MSDMGYLTEEQRRLPPQQGKDQLLPDTNKPDAMSMQSQDYKTTAIPEPDKYGMLLQRLTEFGYSRQDAYAALERSQGSLVESVKWLENASQRKLREKRKETGAVYLDDTTSSSTQFQEAIDKLIKFAPQLTREDAALEIARQVEFIEQLVAQGWSRSDVRKAVSNTKGDFSSALSWLQQNAKQSEQKPSQPSTQPTSVQMPVKNQNNQATSSSQSASEQSSSANAQEDEKSGTFATLLGDITKRFEAGYGLAREKGAQVAQQAAESVKTLADKAGIGELAEKAGLTTNQAA